MININLDLETYNLLPQLPDIFSVDGLAENANVSILLDDMNAYQTSLVEYEGQAKFYGLRDIVKMHMENLTLPSPACRLRIMVVSGSETQQTSEVYVIYAAYTPGDTTAENYIKKHFLSSRTYFEVPDGAECKVTMMVTESGLTPYVLAVCQKDGETTVRKISLETISAQTPCVVSLDMAPATVKALGEQQCSTDIGKILEYGVFAGERYMSLFVRRDEPEVVFKFRNAFNVNEMAYIYGSTKIITDVSRKEAICMHRKSYYDEEVTRKNEVTTEALSYEQAIWFNELFTSKRVTKDVGGGLEAVVLLSDITSEISYSQDAVNRHKFSWEYEDKQMWVKADDHERIFTEQYTPVFE